LGNKGEENNGATYSNCGKRDWVKNPGAYCHHGPQHPRAYRKTLLEQSNEDPQHPNRPSNVRK
jgi:hypothetical protein